jgi:demethylmenaquinone methyltransferase/2-methoxy-6-polyprenyl-1,4-benzoquinol methylase
MAEEDPVALVERFFAGTERSYDAMVHWATLGFDGRWKRRMLAHIPDGDGPVLDLACGTGISTLSIARRFPGRLVIGVELRDEDLQIAREKRLRTEQFQMASRCAAPRISKLRSDSIASVVVSCEVRRPFAVDHVVEKCFDTAAC